MYLKVKVHIEMEVEKSSWIKLHNSLTLCFHISVAFVERWPLMDPNELVFVLTVYLLFAFKIGPKLLEYRLPLEIKGFLVFYNVFKVVNSSLLMCKVSPKTLIHFYYTILNTFYKYSQDGMLT